VEAMRGGSVILDLAAEGGGNCELTQAGETVLHNRVKIAGPLNVPGTVANHASELYAKNLLNFLELLIKEGEININLDDEIINDSLLTHDGKVHHPTLRERMNINQGAES
jgi:NAD(P) transhydrogenase subunit alpha